MRFFKIVSLTCVMMFALTACVSGTPTSDNTNTNSNEMETYKFGVIGPLTGDAAVYGLEPQKVLDYKLKDINAELAKKGKKIELVYEDGKCTGTDAVNAFQKLRSVDNIQIILGGTCSAETLAVSPLAQDQKVLLASALSSNPAIEDLGSNTFTFSYNDDLIGTAAAENMQLYLKAISAEHMKPYNRVAIITGQSDYAVGIQKVWEREMKKYPNLEVVANEVFSKDLTDFRNVLEKVKKAKPDALFLNPMIGTSAEILLKQMAEMKDAWKEVKLFSQVSYLTDDTRKEVPELAEGMVVIDAPKMTDPGFLKVWDAIVAEKGSLNNVGAYYTAALLDELKIISDLVVEFDGDAMKMRDALSSRSFKGYIGDIAFKGNNFVQNIPAGKYIIKDGKAVFQE